MLTDLTIFLLVLMVGSWLLIAFIVSAYKYQTMDSYGYSQSSWPLVSIFTFMGLFLVIAITVGLAFKHLRWIE